MKELTNRIEECLARLKELPALIRAEREKMNGKAAIEDLKVRLKIIHLDWLAEADTQIDSESKKKVYPNEKTREKYALGREVNDPEYQQISEEAKRFDHLRNTASMNHEALTKEFSGCISTVDVLREMLVLSTYQIQSFNSEQFDCDTLSAQIEVAKAETNRLQVQRESIRNKMKEASSEKG